MLWECGTRLHAIFFSQCTVDFSQPSEGQRLQYYTSQEIVTQFLSVPHAGDKADTV